MTPLISVQLDICEVQCDMCWTHAASVKCVPRYCILSLQFILWLVQLYS